jgi:ectoine hydrolase
MPSFQQFEYQQRIKKVKERMCIKGIDVLLVTDPANMNYLTGYNSWSYYVHQLVVIFIDEEEPLWVGRGLDKNAAIETTWLTHQNIISYNDDFVQSITKHPMDFVAGLLVEKGQNRKRIGVEMDAYYFTAQCYMRLIKGLPDASFSDATSLINWIRLIKSDQEIQYMKNAGEIVEKAMQAGIDSIQEGVRECDVAANISHAQIRGTESLGGDYPAIVPLLPAGARTAITHHTWSEERYNQGDPVIIEIAGCYRRYHTPLSRTVVLGAPSPKLLSITEVVIDGINATLAAIKPGITCEAVEEAWRKTVEKSKVVKDSRIGYPVGLNYPPDWGEHTASLRKGDYTILEPNMVFHLIPGFWIENHGVVISETFRVTETGCETLANFPRKLIVK